MDGAPTIRRAVRVLLVDERERVLLLRLALTETGRVFWQTPGGGIEPGEDPPTAAAREVLEETGLTALPPAVEVWTRRLRFTFREVDVDQHERWLLARVAHFQPHPAGLTEEERSDITGWRWWTLDELDRADEELAPHDLAARLRALLRDGPPAHPVDIDT